MATREQEFPDKARALRAWTHNYQNLVVMGGLNDELDRAQREIPGMRENWRTVSDETYGEAVATFGEKGVAELVCVVGYYTMAAMTLNVFQLPVPDGVEDPLD